MSIAAAAITAEAASKYGSASSRPGSRESSRSRDWKELYADYRNGRLSTPEPGSTGSQVVKMFEVRGAPGFGPNRNREQQSSLTGTTLSTQNIAAAQHALTLDGQRMTSETSCGIGRNIRRPPSVARLSRHCKSAGTLFPLWTRFNRK